MADLVVWAPKVESANWVDVVGNALDLVIGGEPASESGGASIVGADLSVIDGSASEDLDECISNVTLVTLASDGIGGLNGM